jgi:hypothetical protein
MEHIQEYVDGLRMLEAEGFTISGFQANVTIKRGDEVIEFALDSKTAGVVNPGNRNIYHSGADPYEAYQAYAADAAKKKKKSAKFAESAVDLHKLCDAFARRVDTNRKAKNTPAWQCRNKTREVMSNGYIKWIIWEAKDGSSLVVLHNKTTNRFRFDRWGFKTTKSDQNWVTPHSFLQKMAKHPELVKLMVDPALLEEK